MKIGVIGTINKDSIVFSDGTGQNGWGGILYNLVALDSAIRANDTIVPVCNIGNDCYSDINRIISKLKKVDRSLLRRVSEPNNHCHLKYHDLEHKSEILKGGVRPLTYSDVEPLLDTDIVLLNFISGKDINPRSLYKFRHNYNGLIYTDIHSLTLGRRHNGERYLRKPRGWKKVVGISDYIQANRRELELLTGSRSEDPETALSIVSASLNKAKMPIDNKIFIITDGANGCYLSGIERNKSQLVHIAPTSRLESGNTTGCGDVFSAGFISGLAQNYNPIKCARLANRTAGERIDDKYGIYRILSLSE